MCRSTVISVDRQLLTVHTEQKNVEVFLMALISHHRNLLYVSEIWNSDKVEEKPEIFFLLNLTFKDFPFYSFTIFLKTFG